MLYHFDPRLRPTEVHPPRPDYIKRARMLRRRRTLRQVGAIAIYGTAFALIILYGAYLFSPWWQVAAR
jgi:hypothetical protein